MISTNDETTSDNASIVIAKASAASMSCIDFPLDLPRRHSITGCFSRSTSLASFCTAIVSGWQQFRRRAFVADRQDGLTISAFSAACRSPILPSWRRLPKFQKNPKPRNPRPQVQGPPTGRAADRAGAGRTAQSRDQPRRCRHGLGHRPAAAAGQFVGPPRRRRGGGAPRARLDQGNRRRRRQTRCPAFCDQRSRRSPAGQLRHVGDHPHARPRTRAPTRPADGGRRRRGAGPAAAQQDGSVRRQGDRRCAGESDPRRPPGIQGR